MQIGTTGERPPPGAPAAQRATRLLMSPARARAGLSYFWFITWFELAGILIAAATVLRAPHLRIGTTGILSVLTACTFLATQDVYNAKDGIYALTHATGATPKIVMPTSNLLGDAGFKFFKGEATLMAGLILCDVFNSLLVMAVGADEPASSKTKPADV